MSLTRRTALALAAAAPAALAMTRPAAATTYRVVIQGFTYHPEDLEIAAGDTLIFTNRDNAKHTATAVDDSFDTGTLASGESATVTMSTPGSFDYVCRFHSSMKARVTVA